MKILFCSDGSVQAENAIRFGALIAAACKTEATVLGISEHPGELDKILDALKRGLQLLKEKNVSAELITKTGDAITEIIKRTQESDYDLVIVGAVQKDTKGPFWMSAKAYKIIKEIK